MHSMIAKLFYLSMTNEGYIHERHSEKEEYDNLLATVENPYW